MIMQTGMPPSPAMGFPTGLNQSQPAGGNQNAGGTTYGGKPLSAWGGNIPLGLPFGGGQQQPPTVPASPPTNTQPSSPQSTGQNPNGTWGSYPSSPQQTQPQINPGNMSPTQPQNPQPNQQSQGQWQQQAQALPGMNPQIMSWLTQMMQGQQGGGAGAALRI